MSTLQVAIVGAGWMAQEHARELSGRPDIAIRGICDVDGERAAALAARHGARPFGYWSDMVDVIEPDAVWVCTPPGQHAEVALGLFDRGLPVYLEKPIARSFADGRAIAARAEDRGAVCAVGYQWHALDLLDPVRQALDGRPIGFAVGKNVGNAVARPWFVRRADGGGNILERGSHHIDLVRALGGEVTSVQAAASTVPLGGRPLATGDIEDGLTMILHLESGGTATILVVWLSSGLPASYNLEIAAAAALLHLELDPDFRLDGIVRGTPIEAQSMCPPLRSSIEGFLAAVRSGDPAAVACTPSDALRTLAVAQAAEEALETGQTVTVTG
jgi:myo-inositol 2-dehydrogenase/D-chiro-inositol 1-dehydrogenase